VLPFWGMSAVGIAFGVLGATWARHIGTTHHLQHLDKTALVVLANIAAFGVFWVLKLMVFNRLFLVEDLLEEIDERVEAEEGRSSDAPVR
jgi:hypothetical protein